jgi:hypothetical protein
MALTLWVVIVEGKETGMPMEYSDALKLENEWRLKGYSASMKQWNN